ncbi:glucose-1-phosphate adenylyltransferase/glucose-1-phosphate adenylyltransferase, GlgD subunit [Halobacteroides halobius DSM 5150]|uniref:Glucose-1-phosphate adenylyltransferase n=1 Tax=Halobacteroides halobius (strain ATCC 35273 / DSM 5150 / MD-1) TaxID=748449 RepID=L0K9Q4_HALHC|nr:glucose-1-phosphate adenylyltransferase [Halobacteroides halobius]AGB41104.1 glucose-1-phosphate adenylyltransferase/glucose-1-phosphate adenylyltransferase, GlgD subunit [Halobacteroides halobius DSM 5150]
MRNLALILAGGRGTRLDVLSEHRAKPSVPFAGKFRLIDFALSNCVNSGIYDIGVLTQYLPMSLNEHIGIGKPWDLDRRIGGITLLQPYTGKSKKGGWYQGTAHAVYQNINFIKQHNPDNVVILSGDHVYKMDYSHMIAKHEQSGADLTIAAQRVPYEEASRFGILEPDEEMQVVDFKEKPENPPSNLASMGIYVFKTEALLEVLEEDCTQESSDFGHHIIPPMIENDQVYSYEFEGYWKDVGTLESFWKTNLSLASSVPELNLYDEGWKLHTRSKEQPPVKFGAKGNAVGSIVSNGSIINGKVENSVIAPGVFIEEGAVVRDSIIFNNTIIKKDSIVCKSIIDKRVVVGSNCHIGFGNDLTPNHKKPQLLNNGLNVIAKGAEIPANTQVGRNCRIFSYVTEEDFESQIIPSGNTVAKQSAFVNTSNDEVAVTNE